MKKTNEIGIYVWHARGEKRYCIGEWNPLKKQYANLSCEEAARYRINQEISSKDGTSKYTMSNVIIDYCDVLDFYNPDGRTSHFDKLIHLNLTKKFGNDVQVATEFFELDKCWKNPNGILIDAVKKTAENKWSSFNPARPFSFPPRQGSQDVAIDKVIAAYNRGCKKFLLGAKCRFGKTFTSYEIMKQAGFSSTLIVTFRPSDTKNAWLNDLNSHQDFDSYQFFMQKELADFKNFPGKKVLFVSYQKIKKDVTAFLDEMKRCFDFVKVDEDQIGSHHRENRNIIKKLRPKFTLVNTGTPELEILSNEFEEDYQYTWDYIDEQEAKAKGIPGYEDMPKLELRTFDISNKFADTITGSNGFSLSEFFKVENGDFVHYAQVLKLLKYLYYDYSNGSEEIDETLGIFASKITGELKHGVWKLPRVEACECLKRLIEANFPDVYAEVLPTGNKNPREIEKTCAAQEALGKSTVWLTVVKNTVGVTVKPWTYALSLYGSDSSSLTSYIQYIFRAGSPGKSTFYSFDFCPKRALDVADQLAQIRAVKHNTSYDAEIAKVLNYLPLFAYNGVGGWKQLDSNSFFSSISKFSTMTSTSNLVKDCFTSMFDYKDELADVKVGSAVPVVSNNDVIIKLKKELVLKNKPSSKKEEKEMSTKDLTEKMFQVFIDIYSFVKLLNDYIENLDDFVQKLNELAGNYESCFGYSEEFVKALIAVMLRNRRSFEIAIQRFKHIEMKPALEDVPDELSKRMVAKLNFKEGETVCDWYCKGPGLLKNIPSYCKLYARIKKSDVRTELIMRKLMPQVNIIKEDY